MIIQFINILNAYNVIYGRPALVAFPAMASPMHMAIKFPTIDERIRVIQGDQGTTQQCYVDFVKQFTTQNAGSASKKGTRSLEMSKELLNIKLKSKKPKTTT